MLPPSLQALTPPSFDACLHAPLVHDSVTLPLAAFVAPLSAPSHSIAPALPLFPRVFLKTVPCLLSGLWAVT